MKIRFLSLALLVAGLVSCESTNDTNDDEVTLPTGSTPEGAYMLCAGNYDQNNSTLDFYNPLYPDELVTKVFASANDRALGSNANDMAIHGSKMYIAVSTSATLEVTDLRGNSLKTLNFATETGIPQEPRFVAASGENVYVSLYDGYVAVVDTVTLQITKRIPVGSNPEQLCVIGRKLYVAESGGYLYPDYNNTIGVIDLDTNEVSGQIVTGTNPNCVAADKNGNLYILCYGNYGDEPNSLIRLNPSNAQTETLASNSQILFAVGSDRVYIYSARQENWVVTEKSISSCPIEFGQTELTGYMDDASTPNDIYSLSVDPTSGNLYVGMTDYTTYGSMGIYTPEAEHVVTHSLSSINPRGAWFVTK